jgi:hypothetical protein
MDLLVEEHHMPGVEAMLAGTLALMTGYSQYLQAASDPAHRAGMGEKIAHNLALLAGHPQLSGDCRCVLWQLHERWAVMSNCTVEAAGACQSTETDTESDCAAVARSEPVFTLPAPRTLQ